MFGNCDHATSSVRLPWPSTDNSVPPTATAHGSLAGKLTERSPKVSSAKAAQSPLATKTVICSTFVSCCRLLFRARMSSDEIICFVYTQADADHAACISVGCILINDALQFIVHLRPGIVIGIAISLVDLDRGRWGQTCNHLYVQCRFTLRIRWGAIDVYEREMTFEVNTAQVVLNIIRV